MVTLVHRPSSPSVKFTPLSVPSVTKTEPEQTGYPEKEFPILKPACKGNEHIGSHLAAVKHIPGKMPVITICPASF